jgi:ABC-type spermidine/putrescine transport system permease subunit I
MQVAGQTFLCLALSFWLASKLSKHPSRAHTVLMIGSFIPGPIGLLRNGISV